MEVLCIGAIALAILVFPIWAIIQILELRTREEVLEKKVQRLQKQIEGGIATDIAAERRSVKPQMKSPSLGKPSQSVRTIEEEIELDREGTSAETNSGEETAPPRMESPVLKQELPSFGEGAGSTDVEFSKKTEEWKQTLKEIRLKSVPAKKAQTTTTPTEVKPKKPAMSLERRMVWGAVWVGAIALVMAGVYLVKEAIESGLLGPAVRTGLTAGAGLLALGIGEYLRRTQKQIAHGVTAAGVSLLYAALIGATTLHHLIPDSLGMVLMIGITALAVGLSLRHGPFVALLGLLGGFIMPKLLSSEPSSAMQLFGYLILLQIGLIAVTRYRGWYWLMFGTFLGGVGWSLLWILFVYQPADAHFVALFLMVSTLAFLFGVPNALTSLSEDWQSKPYSVYLPWCTVLTAMGLFVMLIGKTNFPTTEWCYFGILGAGCIVLARIQPRYFPAPVLSCVLSAALAWAWRSQGLEGRSSEFLWICAGLGGIYGIGGFAALWRASRPDFWGWLSAAGGIVFLFIARYSVPSAENWEWIFLTVAGAYGAASIPLLPRRTVPPLGESLAAMIAAATTAVAFAIQYALESREIRWIWVGWCWSLLLPVLSGLMVRLKLPRLADLLTLVQCAAACLLLLNPQMFAVDYGDHPIFNQLWVLFGIPLGCTIAARSIVGRWSKDDWLPTRSREGLLRGLELLAVCFALVLTTLLVRHGFNPDFKLTETIRLLEWAFYVNSWLALAILLKSLSVRHRTPILRGSALLVCGVTIGLMFLVTPALWFSMMFESAAPRDWGIDVLAVAFWVPIGLVFTISRMFRFDSVEELQGRAMEAAGWCLAVIATGVSIRRGFHAVPSELSPTWWELSTYPLLWGGLAIAVLWIGLYQQRRWTQQIGAWLLFAAGVAHAATSYVIGNPLLQHIDVGSLPIANGILYAFGSTIVVGLVAMKLLQRANARTAVIGTGIFTQIAVFSLVTFEVRQWFHGAYLDEAFSSNAERYCYSAAWIVLGIFLLILGIVSKGKAVRFGSLAIMLVSVLKVFIVDMQHLEDLWRVVSFLGLGVSLLMLVAVYQKFVFGDSNSLEAIERLDREETEETG